MSAVVADSGQVLGHIFNDALRFAAQSLQADRAVVLSVRGKPGYRGFRAWATHGIDRDAIWTDEPISLGLFDQVIDSGRPLYLADAQNDLEASSFLSVGLSGIRSVLCFPFFNADRKLVGMLYADSLVRVNHFRPGHVRAVQDYLRSLEQRLHLLEQGRYSEAESMKIEVKVSTRPKFTPSPEPKPLAQKAPEQPKVVSKTPDAPSVRPAAGSPAFFFRCLATAVGAGLPLHQALELAKPAEDPAFHKVVDYLAHSVQSGQTLSRAMAQCQRAFDNFQIAMIKVGEESGSLHGLLNDLSGYEEEHLRRTRELKGTLSYPLFILTLCSIMLILGPPLFLQGQRKLLAASGTEMPAISRIVFGISEFLAGPGLIPLVSLLLLAGIMLAKNWHRPGFVRWRWTMALRLPVMGSLLRTFVVTRFSTALAFQLKAGILLSQALPTSAATTGVPSFQDAVQRAVKELLSGANLVDSLESTGFFPPVFLGLLRAGEESGAIPQSLESASSVSNLELEAAYQRFSAMIQPITMLVMGVIVGVMMIATMLPMVQALNNL